MQINVENILKLGEMGFTAEQINAIIGLEASKSAPSPAPIEEPKVVEEVKEVEQPQIDYKKLADEIALRQQKSDTYNPETPKPEEKPELPTAENVILGFL